MSHIFSIEKEYFRLVAQIYFTEDGAYKELPDNLSSSYIQVEVVYYMMAATSSGEIRVFPYANTPAMNKLDVKGGPVMFGDTVLFTEEGAGTTTLTLSRNYNPRLATEERQRLDIMWNNILATGAKWYE